MLENQAAAEGEAIRVWMDFLEAADVPRGLRIAGSEDSLDDLIVVNLGPSGGRDRK